MEDGKQSSSYGAWASRILVVDKACLALSFLRSSHIFLKLLYSLRLRADSAATRVVNRNPAVFTPKNGGCDHASLHSGTTLGCVVLSLLAVKITSRVSSQCQRITARAATHRARTHLGGRHSPHESHTRRSHDPVVAARRRPRGSFGSRTVLPRFFVSPRARGGRRWLGRPPAARRPRRPVELEYGRPAAVAASGRPATRATWRGVVARRLEARAAGPLGGGCQSATGACGSPPACGRVGGLAPGAQMGPLSARAGRYTAHSPAAARPD